MNENIVKEAIKPHPYDIVKEESLKLLFKLNGQQARPETALILSWLMSHNWALVSDTDTAERTWNDLSLHGEGNPVTEAVDFIVEITMRSIAQFQYYGIFDAVVESFLKGQISFSKSKAVHSHLKDRLPDSKIESPHSRLNKGHLGSILSHQQISYSDLISQEPWVMVCALIVRSGVLHEIDQRLDKARTTKVK